ncbi:MAG TPA: AMP-binding protein [Xanthomonadales bacterium]|nr:AMP-binding protein [Xanthomonadales bacterium]
MNAFVSTPASVGHDDALPLLAGDDGRARVAWVDGRSVTASEFLADVAALAATLPTRTHAVNLCEDRYRFLVAFAAALARGQTVLLPPSRAAQVVAEVQGAHPSSHCMHDGFELAVEPPGARAGGTSASSPVEVPRVPGSHTAAVGFTSGSTGTPKPHAKTWSSFAASTAHNARRIRASLAARGLGPHASIVATVPPQHMYGMETTVLLPLLGGFAVHGGKPLFPADIAAALAEVDAPRVLVSTPVHLRALLDSGQALPGVAIVVSATAPLDRELAARIERAWGCDLLEVFGSTETCVIATRRTAHEDAWLAYPDVTLAPGPDGTRVDAPWFAQPNWLQDVVELERDGRFVLRGRNVDMVEIAGKRASLAELTRRLLAVPGVRDGVVVQLDAEAGGVRRIAALAVADRPASEILASLRDVVDPAFLPRPLRLVAQLPRNEVGKLPREMVLEALRG